MLELNHHTSHDRVSVVRTTFKVYGKRQTLTLSQPKTSEPIVTKFEWHDYIEDVYHQNKFGLNLQRGFAPHIGELYTPFVFACLGLLFLVLLLAYRRVCWTDFHAQYGSAFFNVKIIQFNF